MQWNWNDATACYEFDTGVLFGCIRPFGHYHGIGGLMHRKLRLDLVRPEKAFLNAEYYIRPASGRQMLPRNLSHDRKTTHETRDHAVTLHFPPEPEFGLHLELSYLPHADIIDMRIRIRPTKDVDRLEIFFASYVCAALSETWVPLRNPKAKRAWVMLDNRRRLNGIFGIMSDRSLRDLLPRQYPNHPVKVEKRVFSEPILVAKEPAQGLAIIFLCDPQTTKYLAGQYHGWDTAHDWSLTADLAKGREVEAWVRMICRSYVDAQTMFEEIPSLWVEFRKERLRVTAR